MNNPQRSQVRTHGVQGDQTQETFRANEDTTSSNWGDVMILPKPEKSSRFTFQNIQGLPVNSQSHKHQQIRTAIQETDTDIFGMVELSLNFKVLGPNAQWKERFQALKRNHSIHTYNIHDSSLSRTLFGGTPQITMGKCSHRAISSGADESGMSRWVWTLLAGKNNTKIRIISGYRPNPDHSDRTGSVFSQQERRLRTVKDDRKPRRAFI